MDKLLLAATVIVTLAGCQTMDRPVRSTRAAHSQFQPASTAQHLPTVDVAAVSPDIGSNPPEPDALTESDHAHSQGIVPVGYQIDGELLPPTEPTSDLTLPDLESMALQNSPAVAQAAAQVRAARGAWIQAGLPPNPRMGYSSEEMGDDGSAGKQGGLVAQEFVTAGKLRLNRQVAARQIRRLEQELEATRLRVLTDVRIGYYDVLIAQRRRKLAVELVRVSKKGIEAAEALFKSEEVSEADPLRARVQADVADVLLQNSINQHVEAWRRLIAAMGRPDLSLQHLDGDLDADNVAISWQEQLRRVLTESPELAAALTNVESARWAVERAYAEAIPNVNTQAVVQRNDVNGDTLSGVQIVVPIPILNRNQGGIRRTQAEAAAAERAVDRLALDLQTRLAAAFQRYKSAENQVRKYSGQNGILDNSGRTLELIRAGYQAEEFGALDLLAAQRTYFEANLAYLDSLREMWVSATEIDGLLLKDSLKQ